MIKKNKLNYMPAVAKTEPVKKIPVSSKEMEKLDRSIREKCRQNSINNCKVDDQKVYYAEKTSHTVIDLSSRSNIQIIPKSKEEIDYSDCIGKVVIEAVSGTKKSCAEYDPFGLCTILECLYCDNCAFRIKYNDGREISSGNVSLIDSSKNKINNINYKHEILFYDRVPNTDELFSYLNDEKSSYRIIRSYDNVIMINNKKEIIVKEREKSKSLIKRLINKRK